MKQLVFVPKPFTLAPMNKKQLGLFLGLSKHSLRKWLSELESEVGPPIAGIYSVKQVQIIIDHYGMPGDFVWQDAA